MPQSPINYTNSVIYKIQHYHNLELIYIGSTTNFIRRKYQHKTACNNNNDRAFNYKLYQMIRENGGWESFKIMIIKEFPCNNKIELLIEEDKHHIESKATLNCKKAFCTEEDNKKKDKEYYEINKSNINAKHNNNYKINKAKILETQKEYYNVNKEVIKLKNKLYYDNNKDKIKLRRQKNPDQE